MGWYQRRVHGEGEKPVPVKTHYRNMVVVPEMIGAIVAIYNGKEYMPIEMKFNMIGKYLGEFAMSYKPTRHGKPGVGATKGSCHTDKNEKHILYYLVISYYNVVYLNIEDY